MANTLPTAQSIINLALKMIGVIGVGQTAQAEDANDALIVMNMMLAQWQRKRWLVYSLEDHALTATGATSYTVGTGGNFNIPRPDKLEAVYARLLAYVSQPVDYTLTLLEAMEDYNRIQLKTLATFPQIAFYDAAYPLGNLYIWPVPSDLYEIHLTVKSALSSFPTLTTTMNLPPEYQEAILYNLAGRLRPAYGLPPEQTITALARAALGTLRAANAQIPRLVVPAQVTRQSLYNIYGDQSY